NLTYRPENFACATAAVLFRLVGQNGGCTLLLDETDARPNRDVLDVLRNGFSQGGSVRRCAPPQQDYEVLEFPTYGPKVIAGQHPLDDGALQSRIITENMGIISEGRKHKPYLPKCFWKDGADLQGRLLKWGRRVGEIHHKNVMKQMPDALDGRAQQVMLPLF